MISASRRGDSIKGSPPVRMTSQISAVRADIVERGAIGGLRQRGRLARSDHFAAKTEAAIHRADVHQLEQHPVGIAMHDAGDRRMRVVADRIGVFAWRAHQFQRARNELPRDRIVGVFAVDQARRCQASPRWHSARRPVRDRQDRPPAQARARSVRRVAATLPPVSDRSCSCLTCRWRPYHLIHPQRAACQHHQPVEAERDAARMRHRRDRGEKILIERIALAIAPLLLVHRLRETAALFGRIGQFAKPVGEFDAAGIDLKPFGDARIGRLWSAPVRLPAPDIRTIPSNAPAPDWVRHARPAPC